MLAVAARASLPAGLVALGCRCAGAYRARADGGAGRGPRVAAADGGGGARRPGPRHGGGGARVSVPLPRGVAGWRVATASRGRASRRGGALRARSALWTSAAWVVAAVVVYAAIGLSGTRWWLVVGAAFAAGTAALALLGPLLLRPALRARPLGRPGLAARLEALARRAGAPVVGVHEWPEGPASRPNAALVGVGTGAARPALRHAGCRLQRRGDRGRPGPRAGPPPAPGHLEDHRLPCRGRLRRRLGRAAGAGGPGPGAGPRPGRPTPPACRSWPSAPAA